MDSMRFAMRNGRKDLFAVLCTVMLLLFVLGQSSAGGCGARRPVSSPGSNPESIEPAGIVDETVDPDDDGFPDGFVDETVDTDGDGFPDELEIISMPGTDPQDPADNPNNVRDSDGDGCSDFDEINFYNFCDENPFTTELLPADH